MCCLHTVFVVYHRGLYLAYRRLHLPSELSANKNNMQRWVPVASVALVGMSSTISLAHAHCTEQAIRAACYSYARKLEWALLHLTEPLQVNDFHKLIRRHLNTICKLFQCKIMQYTWHHEVEKCQNSTQSTVSIF
jgi:hypothetical protein